MYSKPFWLSVRAKNNHGNHGQNTIWYTLQKVPACHTLKRRFLYRFKKEKLDARYKTIEGVQTTESYHANMQMFHMIIQ